MSQIICFSEAAIKLQQKQQAAQIRAILVALGGTKEQIAEALKPLT